MFTVRLFRSDEDWIQCQVEKEAAAMEIATMMRKAPHIIRIAVIDEARAQTIHAWTRKKKRKDKAARTFSSKGYTWMDPHEVLPLLEDADFDKGVIAAAGFAPEDEELQVFKLKKEWNGHKKGAWLVSGLQCEGHPFTVVEEV